MEPTVTDQTARRTLLREWADDVVKNGPAGPSDDFVARDVVAVLNDEERRIAEAVAAEREACAELAERAGAANARGSVKSHPEALAIAVAAAIRNRGEAQ